MTDYELHDNDDIPEDVRWTMVNNHCIHYNSKPAYAREVEQNEDCHPAYYLDQLPFAAG